MSSNINMALIGFQGGDTRPATPNQKSNQKYNQKNMKDLKYWMGVAAATQILIEKTLFSIEEEKDYEITVEGHDDGHFKVVFSWVSSFVEESFMGNHDSPPDGISPVYDGTILIFNYNENTNAVVNKLEDTMYHIYTLPMPSLLELEENPDWER